MRCETGECFGGGINVVGIAISHVGDLPVSSTDAIIISVNNWMLDPT